ncbi:LPXTG cell wall anchor domain-containing protein [Secundilactobacillus collinoides]|uniref:LPXTG cell wall anchor domain-containing protein n=1 Tax=Secundilactobacillus collinoides TaxID=33960 RepID=UPI00158586A4
MDLETPTAVTNGGARQSAQTPQNGAKTLPQTDEQNGASVKALGLVGLMTLLLGMLPWKKQE